MALLQHQKHKVHIEESTNQDQRFRSILDIFATKLRPSISTPIAQPQSQSSSTIGSYSRQANLSHPLLRQ